MGAAQVGGLATMLDLDFNNIQGFTGTPVLTSDGLHMVHYLSHAMLFCTGALIDTFTVITPAPCIYNERYRFPVFAGTHNLIKFPGTPRDANDMCVHKAYNHSRRWTPECSANNVALLVFVRPFQFKTIEPGAQFPVLRVRIGLTIPRDDKGWLRECAYHGWGSRRNGFLFPLLAQMRRVDVVIVPKDQCDDIWNTDGNYLCMLIPPCKDEKHGALCPDDLGAVIDCEGYAQGIMTSQLLDRPCNSGFLDLEIQRKFITCATADIYDLQVNNTRSFITIPPEVYPTGTLSTDATPEEEIVVTKEVEIVVTTEIDIVVTTESEIKVSQSMETEIMFSQTTESEAIESPAIPEGHQPAARSAENKDVKEEYKTASRVKEHAKKSKRPKKSRTTPN